MLIKYIEEVKEKSIEESCVVRVWHDSCRPVFTLWTSEAFNTLFERPLLLRKKMEGADGLVHFCSTFLRFYSRHGAAPNPSTFFVIELTSNPQDNIKYLFAVALTTVTLLSFSPLILSKVEICFRAVSSPTGWQETSVLYEDKELWPN